MFTEVFMELARENGTTPEEVRKEMQQTIHMAYQNCSDPKTKALQDMVPRKGEIPTVEEFLWFLSMTVEARMKEQNLDC